MRKSLLIAGLVVVASFAAAAVVEAQSPGQRAPAPPTVTPPTATCPPEIKESPGQAPPTVSGPSAPDLSSRLADSKGVICPPGGVDPDIHVPPREGGEMRVIPAPGAPGGDPNVQPK